MITPETRQRLIDARRHLAAGLIAVKPHLDTAYPDHPEWTPWTRFVNAELDALWKAIDEVLA